MDEQLKHALARGRTTNINTRGRKTGQLRRTESWFHHIDGQVYLTRMPRRHDWYAKMVAHPEFTSHLKQGTTADLPARATPIQDAARRRQLLIPGGLLFWCSTDENLQHAAEVVQRLQVARTPPRTTHRGARRRG